MDKKEKKTAEEIKAEKNHPGAAVDAADKDHVTPQEVKERTDVLDGPASIGGDNQ